LSTAGLPTFRYHPDPVRTESIVPADIVCGVCGQPRDHSYVGPYGSPDFHFENDDPICPWCIADGSAAQRWQASFIAPAALSTGARAQMTAEALAELQFRTPSYLSLQPGIWLDHHGEASAYLGEVGAEDYRELPPPAQVAVRTAAGDHPARELRDTDLVLQLRADGNGPTAYLFQCLHCGQYESFTAGG
jgi:uncharacterized protein CbrC (UPF0167 family)